MRAGIGLSSGHALPGRTVSIVALDTGHQELLREVAPDGGQRGEGPALLRRCSTRFAMVRWMCLIQSAAGRRTMRGYWT